MECRSRKDARYAYKSYTLRRQCETRESFELVRKHESVAHDMVKQVRRVQRTSTPELQNRGNKQTLATNASTKNVYSWGLIIPKFPIKFDNEYLKLGVRIAFSPRQSRILDESFTSFPTLKFKLCTLS